MARARVWNEEVGAHLLTEITTPAEEAARLREESALLRDERSKAKILIFSLLGTDDEATQAANLLAWSKAHGAVERFA